MGSISLNEAGLKSLEVEVADLLGIVNRATASNPLAELLFSYKAHVDEVGEAPGATQNLSPSSRERRIVASIQKHAAALSKALENAPERTARALRFELHREFNRLNLQQVNSIPPSNVDPNEAALRLPRLLDPWPRGLEVAEGIIAVIEKSAAQMLDTSSDAFKRRVPMHPDALLQQRSFQIAKEHKKSREVGLVLAGIVYKAVNGKEPEVGWGNFRLKNSGSRKP